VAKGVGPEFKPQYCKKRKKEKVSQKKMLVFHLLLPIKTTPRSYVS
jgi:hypothetical protein